MASDSDDSDKGRLAGCWSSFCGQWQAFLTFLYNPTNKTVLGRGGKSWGQILVFYFFYYAFLAGLFAVAITIVLGTLDPNVPRFQTRLQTPGLAIQPRPPSTEELTTDIIYSVRDYQSQEKQLDKFLADYSNQTTSDDFDANCVNGRVTVRKNFSGGVTPCAFNRTLLSACSKSPYGYDRGEPCILVQANRIINWFPVSYNDISAAVGNEISNAPPLEEVLRVLDTTYNPFIMYFACYGSDDENHRLLTGQSGVNDRIRYYPKGVEFKYYPYYGKARTPQYTTPIVAVQFFNVTRNVEIVVRCKAYSRNIVDDDRLQVGFTQFKLRIDD